MIKAIFGLAKRALVSSPHLALIGVALLLALAVNVMSH